MERIHVYNFTTTPANGWGWGLGHGDSPTPRDIEIATQLGGKLVEVQYGEGWRALIVKFGLCYRKVRIFNSFLSEDNLSSMRKDFALSPNVYALVERGSYEHFLSRELWTANILTLEPGE